MRFIMTVLLVLTIILVGCSALDHLQNFKSPEELKRIYLEAQESNDWKICRKLPSNFDSSIGTFIGGELFEENCITNVAERTRNPAICSNIKDNYDKSFDKYYDFNRNSCFAQLAILTKNKTLCDKIGSAASAGRCVGDLAMISRDFSLCKEILAYKGLCGKGSSGGDGVSGTIDSDCESSLEDEFGDCVSGLMGVDGNVSICDYLAPEKKDFCLARASIYNNDLKSCLDLSEKARDYCRMLLAGPLQNVSLCGNLSSSDEETCYSGLAESTHNLSFCQHLDFKLGCYMDYAVSLNDTSACDLIEDRGYRDDCIMRIALSNLDPGLCDQIEDISHCKMAIEELRSDPWRIASLSG